MTAPVAVAPDPRRRVLIMVAVGAGLVLALVLGSKLLAGGGGGDSPTEAAVTRRAAPVRSESTTATTQAPAAVETFEVFTTKNPFIALRTAAVPAAATASARPAVATATPTATPVSTATAGAPAGPAPAPVPAAPGATAPAPAATAATGGQATEPTRSATRVALLDVFAEGNRTVANVKVNDTVSKVGAGDTFASNFKVVSLDPAARCGRFLYGDDQFRLCKGEEVLK